MQARSTDVATAAMDLPAQPRRNAAHRSRPAARFILPTGAGYLFAVVLAVMLLGAINYTLSLGHALVFLLAGLGLAAMVHTFRNLLGIAITPGRAVPVHAGDVARFPMHLRNAREEGAALGFSFAGGEECFVDLPANGTARIDLPCPAPRRGASIPAG